jgi:hypothetical protein
MDPSGRDIFLVLPPLLALLTFNMVDYTSLLDYLDSLQTVWTIGFASAWISPDNLANSEALFGWQSEDEIVTFRELLYCREEGFDVLRIEVDFSTLQDCFLSETSISFSLNRTGPSNVHPRAIKSIPIIVQPKKTKATIHERVMIIVTATMDSPIRTPR